MATVWEDYVGVLVSNEIQARPRTLVRIRNF
jgi:hypothetical protein